MVNSKNDYQEIINAIAKVTTIIIPYGLKFWRLKIFAVFAGYI